MKKRTKDAAKLIRLVAFILLYIGMISAGVLIVFGVMALATKDNSYVMALFRTTGVTAIIYGLAVVVWQLLIFALLSGFAVIVENSDRSEIENALFEIADKSKDVRNEDEKEPQE